MFIQKNAVHAAHSHKGFSIISLLLASLDLKGRALSKVTEIVDYKPDKPEGLECNFKIQLLGNWATCCIYKMS